MSTYTPGHQYLRADKLFDGGTGLCDVRDRWIAEVEKWLVLAGWEQAGFNVELYDPTDDIESGEESFGNEAVPPTELVTLPRLPAVFVVTTENDMLSFCLASLFFEQEVFWGVNTATGTKKAFVVDETECHPTLKDVFDGRYGMGNWAVFVTGGTSDRLVNHKQILRAMSYISQINLGLRLGSIKRVIDNGGPGDSLRIRDWVVMKPALVTGQFGDFQPSGNCSELPGIGGNLRTFRDSPGGGGSLVQCQPSVHEENKVQVYITFGNGISSSFDEVRFTSHDDLTTAPVPTVAPHPLPIYQHYLGLGQITSMSLDPTEGNADGNLGYANQYQFFLYNIGAGNFAQGEVSAGALKLKNWEHEPIDEIRIQIATWMRGSIRGLTGNMFVKTTVPTGNWRFRLKANGIPGGTATRIGNGENFFVSGLSTAQTTGNTADLGAFWNGGVAEIGESWAGFNPFVDGTNRAILGQMWDTIVPAMLITQGVEFPPDISYDVYTMHGPAPFRWDGQFWRTYQTNRTSQTQLGPPRAAVAFKVNGAQTFNIEMAVDLTLGATIPWGFLQGPELGILTDAVIEASVPGGSTGPLSFAISTAPGGSSAQGLFVYLETDSSAVFADGTQFAIVDGSGAFDIFFKDLGVPYSVTLTLVSLNSISVVVQVT